LKRNGIVAITVLAILLASLVTTASTEPTAAVTSSAPPSTCFTNTDSTATLQSWINSQPDNSTLTMPQGSCWNVEGSITIQNKTGLTINANGSTFFQATSPATSYSPILQLWLNTNLAIENLNIDGALSAGFDNSDEGDYGVELEADNGVWMTGMTMSNIQGDFVYLSPPYDVDTTSDALNKNIWITGSTFQNGGYHGLTIESVDGFVVNNDTFTNINEDAMVLEYDDYSTPFNADGTPFWAAQDNISILNSTWNDWNGSDWFVSDQGQTPGVQQQHVTISGNTLNGDGPLFEIVGTPTYMTDPTTDKTVSTQYLNIWLTITNNAMGPGFVATPYRGGTTTAMSIYSVVALDMENNYFPTINSTYEMDLYNGVFDTIHNNDFTGVTGIQQPQTYDEKSYDVSECGNIYGVKGTHTDAICS
jgi:Right handed beta helix region